MRKILFILAALFVTSAASAQRNLSDSLWDAANTAYVNGEYANAITLYDSILNSGYVSYKLYYNLGNAHFKEGSVGNAILNYERALRLRPTDNDIKHNLKVANGYVKDKIDVVPEFFVSTWIRSLRMSLSSNTWAIISVAFFALALAATLIYLLSKRLVFRKAGFYTAIVSLLIFIMSLTFSAVGKRQMLRSDEAVVMQGATSVKSSPDNASKELFIIHEGTKVEVVRTIGEWCEIMISDGNKGWVNRIAIENI